jgi:hypothetical protein
MKMISDDKSDPQSGSESCGSDDMSHQSSPNVSSSTILSAFTNHDGFAMSEASRSSHLAHYTNATHGSGFFPNGGHLGPTLHMMPAGGYAGHHPQLSGGHSEAGSANGVGSEANRKRAVRLQKNREAARECRRKKKEYIKCLENRVAVLENQNKALIEELKSLKELYTGKGYEASPVPKIEIL